MSPEAANKEAYINLIFSQTYRYYQSMLLARLGAVQISASKPSAAPH